MLVMDLVEILALGAYLAEKACNEYDPYEVDEDEPFESAQAELSRRLGSEPNGAQWRAFYCGWRKMVIDAR